ncbi:hypothetical protein HX882_33345 [Pseudomonas gingeri]|uniref:Uncharacterized protein n=1 Tax=Pseudomonas gingeri TaxID=117681 RepID=A0A7Y7XJQ7_9PSED|nr:hypothetical protein [Pseudomonas gingeri]NWC00762.1 hypothetical protein [Pseudomonas gingeri]
MKMTKNAAKAAMIAKFTAEAMSLATAGISENQRRFLKVGLSRGKELEPTGVLAGARS